MLIREREREPERISEQKLRRKIVITNGMRNYGKTGQLSYSRPHEEVRRNQIILQKNPILISRTAYPLGKTNLISPLPEDLHAKYVEAYMQQIQTYKRLYAEALRERNRLIQERNRNEHERMMNYKQTVQSAQNRIPKERTDDDNRNVWQQRQHATLREKYLNSKQDQTATFSNVSLSANVRLPEEVKRTKLKYHRNFEKLKQIGKTHKPLKTTSKPVVQRQYPKQQNQIRSEKNAQKRKQLEKWQNRFDKIKQSKKGNDGNSDDQSKRLFYTSEPQHQQKMQSYQTSLKVKDQSQQKLSIYDSNSVINKLTGKSEFDNQSGLFFFFFLIILYIMMIILRYHLLESLMKIKLLIPESIQENTG